MAPKAKSKRKYKYIYGTNLEEPKEENLPFYNFRVVLLIHETVLREYILNAKTIGTAWRKAEEDLEEGCKILRIYHVM